MKKAIFGLAILTIIVSGCALRKNNIGSIDWHTIAAYGRVEAVGKDFIVVGFGYIQASHLDSSEDGYADILKIYRCNSKEQHYCKYKVGDSVVTVSVSEKVIKNPISYEISYLQNAKQEDVPIYLDVSGRP